MREHLKKTPCTEEFEVKKGVRQGCILSPILFNIYSEELINDALESYDGVKINGVSYTNIRFADDTAVIAETEEELQNMMTSIINTCEEYGMELNAKKTKTMVVTRIKATRCETLRTVTTNNSKKTLTFDLLPQCIINGPKVNGYNFFHF